MEEEKGFVAGEMEGGSVYVRFVPVPAHDMEIVEIRAAGLTAEACRRAIEAQHRRLREDLVIRFNLTGGSAISDYPDLDFRSIRAAMPPVMECGFAIRAGTRWVYR